MRREREPPLRSKKSQMAPSPSNRPAPTQLLSLTGTMARMTSSMRSTHNTRTTRCLSMEAQLTNRISLKDKHASYAACKSFSTPTQNQRIWSKSLPPTYQSNGIDTFLLWSRLSGYIPSNFDFTTTNSKAFKDFRFVDAHSPERVKKHVPKAHPVQTKSLPGHFKTIN